MESMREKYETLQVGVLRDAAKRRGLKGISTLKKSELIELMLKDDEKERQATEEQERESQQERLEAREEKPKTDYSQLDSGETACGILEVMADGYGFIRCENYLPGENDVYVSPSQIRRFNLKTGDILQGNTRIKSQNEKFSALLYVTKINGFSPNESTKRCNFEDMTPIFPDKRLRLERPGGSLAMRIVDLVSPVGKGQRGMIV